MSQRQVLLRDTYVCGLHLSTEDVCHLCAVHVPYMCTVQAMRAVRACVRAVPCVPCVRAVCACLCAVRACVPPSRVCVRVLAALEAWCITVRGASLGIGGHVRQHSGLCPHIVMACILVAHTVMAQAAFWALPSPHSPGTMCACLHTFLHTCLRVQHVHTHVCAHV